MKRIILHWTAGTNTPNSTDLKAYHFVIAGNGQVLPGLFPVSANAPPLRSGRYAAHTLNCNSDSIGVSLAAMAGAVESPFNPGKYPITEAQVSALARTVVDLSREYGIPITRTTVLTHAEVQPTLGIAQKNKWDIRWLPGMTKPGDAVAVGDVIRARALALMSPALSSNPVDNDSGGNPAANTTPSRSFMGWILYLLTGGKA